jgi:hypothetical protein
VKGRKRDVTPWQVLLLIVGVGCAFGGYQIGKHKGLPGLGLLLGLLLGVIEVIIIACVPQTREAKVAAAQWQYEIQAETARRAGYLFPAQPSQGPWQESQEWQPK